MLSIPGGFINEGETAEDAMMREAKDEISLILEPTAILGIYSDPSRDPRMHIISVTFITRTVLGNKAPNDDAAALQWINVEDELDRLIQSNQIAFDHSRILTDFTNWRNATQGSDEENNKIPTFGQRRQERQVQKRLFEESHPIDRYYNIIYN